MGLPVPALGGAVVPVLALVLLLAAAPVLALEVLALVGLLVPLPLAA